MFVTSREASEQALDGGIEFGKTAKGPATLAEVIAAYETSSKGFVERDQANTRRGPHKTVKFFVAEADGELRKMDVLWFIADGPGAPPRSVHHLSPHGRRQGAIDLWAFSRRTWM